MDYQPGRNVLKVDALSMPYKEAGFAYFIVVYNVNIPIEITEDQEECQEVLERVCDLVTTDFTGEKVYYQITASYVLVHAITGQQRVWSGSFYAHGNAPAQLTAFESFNRHTFVASAIEGITDAERKLARWGGLESQWKLDHLESIIFNIQARVLDYHPVIQRRRFPRHGRKGCRTFPLP